MQTILGSNGQIATELAKEIKRNYTSEIRLVSREPKKVNETDALFVADLTDAAMTEAAVKGSEIAYLTVGIPMDTALWAAQFPIIMQNVIQACSKHQTKLVFFDNTYMYPQDDRVLTEDSEFAPVGPKGEIRKKMALMLLDAIKAKQVEATICRAPEFYGPAKTQSINRATIFEKIKQGKELEVLLSDKTQRTLIWTPDASTATALIGNTPDAYGQTWHLPCDDNRLNYKEFIGLASSIYGIRFDYQVVSRAMIADGAVFGKKAAEIAELLPRYEHDNLFDSTKFKIRFPGFKVTTYREGIEQIRDEQTADKS